MKTIARYDYPITVKSVSEIRRLKIARDRANFIRENLCLNVQRLYT